MLRPDRWAGRGEIFIDKYKYTCVYVYTYINIQQQARDGGHSPLPGFSHILSAPKIRMKYKQVMQKA